MSKYKIGSTWHRCDEDEKYELMSFGIIPCRVALVLSEHIEDVETAFELKDSWTWGGYIKVNNPDNIKQDEWIKITSGYTDFVEINEFDSESIKCTCHSWDLLHNTHLCGR